jgi:hypothetical protein
MAITYVNGRLVRTSEGDRAIAAAKIQKQLREENEARLKGLEKQQKLYVPPVVKDENPPPVDDGAPVRRKVNANMTPERSYVEQNLAILGMKDTPANRAKLRKEYRDDQTKEQQAVADAAAEDAANKTAYEAILSGAKNYESTAQTASEKALEALANLYAPQESSLTTQRQNQLDLLKQVLGQSTADIAAGEQQFVSGVRPTSAYTDLPLTALPQQQNALIAALQSQGAGTGEIQAQQASDAALNDFTKQLLQRSAAQYGDVQQNYLNSVINAGRGASQAGRDYLSMQKPQLETSIGSEYDKLLASLRSERAGAESDVQTRLQDALNEAEKARIEAATKYPIAVPPKPLNTPATLPDTPTTLPETMTPEQTAAEEERKRMALIMAARRAGFNA